MSCKKSCANGSRREFLQATGCGLFTLAALGPHREREGRLLNLTNYENNRSLHRTVAFTSIGTATAGYLLMLFGYH